MNLNAIATQLDTAAVNATAVEQISKSQHITLDQAYDRQRMAVDHRLDPGAVVAGHDLFRPGAELFPVDPAAVPDDGQFRGAIGHRRKPLCRRPCLAAAPSRRAGAGNGGGLRRLFVGLRVVDGDRGDQGQDDERRRHLPISRRRASTESKRRSNASFFTAGRSPPVCGRSLPPVSRSS